MGKSTRVWTAYSRRIEEEPVVDVKKIICRWCGQELQNVQEEDECLLTGGWLDYWRLRFY